MPNVFDGDLVTIIKDIQHSNIDATASSNQTFLMCQLKSFYDMVLISRISCHVIVVIVVKFNRGVTSSEKEGMGMTLEWACTT